MNGEQQVPRNDASTQDSAETKAEAPQAESMPTAELKQAAGAADAAEGTSDASQDVETGQDPVQELTQEVARLKDQLLRTAADFENFRKRSRRDLEDARARSKEETLREVLPVIDNLERAMAASAGATDVESIREGVGMVLKLFEEAASRLGLERIQAVGERFDPNLHEAIQQAESQEYSSGTVMSEAVPGYRLGERLIRAALVVVSKGPGPSASKSGDAAAT